MPDHTTIWTHLDEIDEDWLQGILTKTAQACMDVAGWKSGSTGSDSSGVETDRYGTVAEGAKAGKRRKTYLKYHATAILGLQILLEANVTPSSTHDTKMLAPMLETTVRQGLDLGPSTHNCDAGYDPEDNFALVFGLGMTPNIKQRRPPRHRSAPEQDSPYRRKGAEVFDETEYRKRDMIEGIFGAEEAKNHQLHCRFTKPANMRRFGKIRGIAWNLKVLNRLLCAKELGIPIPPYPNRRASAKPRPRQAPPALMPA